MKKIIALLMMVVMIFTVCACGAKSGGSAPEDKYVFKSDETQKVYKSKNNYMIFYYDKESKIKNIDTIMTFPSEESASSSFEVLKKSESLTVGEMSLEGKYIVIHMTDKYVGDYQQMTADGVESYLRGQGYVLVEKIDDAETTTAKPADDKTEKTAEKKDEKATTKAAEKTTAKANEKKTTKAAEQKTTAASTTKAAAKAK